jgi:CrcB protein
MHKLVLIGVGGLLGTLCRYWFSEFVEKRAQSAFPFGTLAVNLVGCFAAGFLFHVFEDVVVQPDLRLAVFTGFLGGFTTFSAYALQTFTLTSDKLLSLAALNLAVSNVAGLFLVWIGAAVSRAVIPSS